MHVGEIPATLHIKVLEEYQTELIPGTIILLNKVVTHNIIDSDVAIIFCRYPYLALPRKKDILM